jgi:hypothetical protein
MKNILSLFFVAMLTLNVSSQVTKTVAVTIPGSLSTLAGPYLTTVTNLTVTGNIDARDVATMRDYMPLLAVLDLSGVSINTYTGIATTTNSTTYPANEMPQYAFYNSNTSVGKTSLKSIVFPSSITTIGDMAFLGCKGLTNISIPASVTFIGLNVFGNCSGLTSITIPNSVISIGNTVFDGCSSLTSITIPNSVTTLGFNAFRNCTGLTSVTLSNSLDRIANNTFYNCAGLKNISIPNSVTTIYESAFQKCANLTSISIPASVTSIVIDSLRNSNKLTEITVESGNNNYSSIDGVLFDKNQTSLIIYPLGKTNSTYTIPNSVTSIGRYSFCNNQGLTGITISNSVTSIGNYAFNNCTNLTSVSIPNSVTSIGNYAFSNSLGLTSIALPSSVTTIGASAFNNCTNFTSITIPAAVKTIGVDALKNCSKLTEINVENDNQNYSAADGVLFDKNQTTLMQYPMAKTTSDYIIPTSVKIVGSYAFSNAKSLTGVTIPNSVTAINKYAFTDCSGLKSINIPGSVTAVGDYAFQNCTAITSIFINSKPMILDYSGSYINATSFSYSNSIPLNSTTFYGVNNLSCVLNVPYGTKKYYQNTNYWTKFDKITEYSNGFCVDKSYLSMADSVGISKVEIAANVAWTGSSDQTWLTVNPASGTANDSLTLSAQVNMANTSRTAIVTVSASGYVSQTITVIQDGAPRVIIMTPGSLSTSLTATELSTVKNLTLTGSIDARDFKTMRDKMPLLVKLDLSAASIAAYNGVDGTSKNTTIYPENELPTYAFYNADTRLGKSLTSLLLPNLITSIGYGALGNCISLTSLIIPNSVTSIGENAFYGCSGLTYINIPNSVKFIGDRIFYDCTGLKNIAISNAVTSIGTYTFYNCKSLESINIPNAVTSIATYAFANCNSLKSIAIPNSVTSIGDYAFQSCNALFSIYVNSKPLPISSNTFSGVYTSFCVLNVPYGTKKLYAAATYWKSFVNIVEASTGFVVDVKKMNMPAIGGSATVGITANVAWTATSDQSWLVVSPELGTSNDTLSLTAQANQSEISRIGTITVTSPGFESQSFTVSQAGAPAAINVTAGNLSTVLTASQLNGINDLTLTGSIDARDFKTMRDNMPLLTKLDLSGVTIEAYTGTAGSDPYISKYAANEIPPHAFCSTIGDIGKKSLLSLKLPLLIDSIGNFAFFNCVNLADLTIPNSVKSIGMSAFYGCNSFINIVIPNSVTTIGDGAFYACTSLTNITIPNSVLKINSGTFMYCLSLNTINIPNSVTSIGDEAFSTCTRLTSLNIPSSVTSIGKSAFFNCGALTSIDIPASVLFIGNNALNSCAKLSAINVEGTNQTYSSIDGVLFNKNQTTLIQYPIAKTGSSYTIPASVTSLDDSAFTFSSGLTNIVNPASLVTIGSNSFRGCSNLASINIPNSVLVIGNNAFYGCSGLTSIYAYPAYPVDIKPASVYSSSYIFNNVNKSTCKLYVPVGSKAFYQAASQWKDFANIVELTTSVPAISAFEKVRVFPNPVVDKLTIQGLDAASKLSVLDLSGRVMLEKNMNFETSVSLESLHSGHYILQVSNSNRVKCYKIVKQ